MNQDINQKVIRYIIKNTPFGQANLVVKDLLKIIPNLNPDDEVIKAAIKDHNEDHLAIFKGQDIQIVANVLSANEDFYVDQKRQLTVKVDHEKYTIISTDSVELPSDPKLNELRDHLETQLEKYLANSYNDKLSGFYVIYSGDSSEYTFYIGITSKNINLPNFYCGDWTSKWEFTNGELSGELTVGAHYYEEGNVQLKNINTLKDHVDIAGREPRDAATQIVNAITRLENQQQNQMDTIYGKFPDQFFKAMRRNLPVTGTKMDWNLNVHKLVANLKQ